MTIKELRPTIDLLNKRFKGKTMKPENLTIKEFLAGPQFPGLLPQFILAYEQSLYNPKRAANTIKDKSSLIIYVVFTKGKSSDYVVESVTLVAIDLFLKQNQIEPASLLLKQASKS